jgi:ABC-type multidrug transport system ATPase subunit/ABC-type multidrug transport system permease subunit
MSVDNLHANLFMGALFFALILLLVDGIPELSMTIEKLEIFYRQKRLCFYPAWAYGIPAAILKIPLSFVVSLAWTALTYYVIGYSPQASRFFCHFLLLLGVSLSSMSMFRFLASYFQTVVASTTAGTFAIILTMIFGGFVISQPSMPGWLKWAFWISPLSYGEMGLSLNEFLAPRWQKTSSSNSTSIGDQTLESRGLDKEQYYLWISVGALFGFTVLFNVCFILALNFLKPPGSSRVITHEKLSQIQGGDDFDDAANLEERPKKSLTAYSQSKKGRMVLPFQPLTMVFQNMHYYVDTPLEMKERGFTEIRLQLLCDITGAFRPGILTALMGVSGAGKTTLLDVLAGRKTSGYIEGDIKIGGYPKSQVTFARVSGYCEQTDIHSPQLTIEESVIFSAWLRLAADIDAKTKLEFVAEVLETIELDSIKDLLVGMPGENGLSNEQRKRLTIAVELVANPSVIFMDEPTTGLDARSAAIVMRAAKNIVDTGRTIVCTIHQPSIDIFEAFDELILLKAGGRLIYSGSLGQNSSHVIEYFESIPGVPKIRKNYNPATWMLEVTSPSAESELGQDFAEIYKDSALFEKNKQLVSESSIPPPGSRDLHFPSLFSQNGWEQFKSCLWKQNLSYWRSPSYNLNRIVFVIASSILFGILFWKQGKDIHDQQSLFNIMGSMYSAVLFLGINNCSSVLPYVARERDVMYRERFAGMYSSWAFSLAQVVVEIPYLFIQSVVYLIIIYPMIGYYATAYKIFWCFYGMFTTMLYFNYLGMLLVSLTPNFLLAAILSSVFYTLFNLFSGFLIPSPNIPKWWIWLYYITPSSWTLNGLLTSQYGDIYKPILVYGEKKTIAAFIEDYYGFHHDRLGLTAAVLIAFPLVFIFLFSFFMGRLNYQSR